MLIDLLKVCSPSLSLLSLSPFLTVTLLPSPSLPSQGLSHLHNNNLCHFDIKPDNIFLSLDGVTCKLGDFGLCVSEDQGFKNAMEGDAKYLAPELMQGKFGKPADVFRYVHTRDYTGLLIAGYCGGWGYLVIFQYYFRTILQFFKFCVAVHYYCNRCFNNGSLIHPHPLQVMMTMLSFKQEVMCSGGIVTCPSTSSKTLYIAYVVCVVSLNNSILVLQYISRFVP